MNRFQLDCARNIKLIAKSISPKTVVEKEKIEMIVQLADEIIKTER